MRQALDYALYRGNGRICAVEILGPRINANKRGFRIQQVVLVDRTGQDACPTQGHRKHSGLHPLGRQIGEHRQIIVSLLAIHLVSPHPDYLFPTQICPRRFHVRKKCAPQLLIGLPQNLPRLPAARSARFVEKDFLSVEWIPFAGL